MTTPFPSASLTNLRLRADLLARTRAFFAERGYWEVETPILSRDVTVDTHLHPFETTYTPLAVSESKSAGAQRLFLQTSPEFGMKRLLAAGSGSIYQITRAFRNGEVGPLHNPEFTIVEWYRVGGNYQDLMTEVGDLVCGLLDLPPPERITYRQAIERHAAIDPLSASDDDLRALAARHGFADPAADRDNMLNFLLAALVEPPLSSGPPTFLYDYPASQAALARVRPDVPPVAERFELYIAGLELCNGYQELTDPAELRARNRRQNQLRIANGHPPLPEESQLLAAMDAGLPSCAGVALGFDRVMILAAKGQSLGNVVAFPFDRA